jgi:hypothetical protein
MSVDVVYLHIKRAIERKKECFLCTLEDEIEKRYMDTYLSELVMDAPSRENIVESRGFCNYHSYKILVAASKPESSDGHGIALVMGSIIERLIQDLQKQRKSNYHRYDFRELLTNENKCPACVHISDFTEMYAKTVVELLTSSHEEFSTLFKESDGLCVPHFVRLMQLTKAITHEQGRGVMETEMEVEEKNLLRLNSALSEYIRRLSYEFSAKDREATGDSALKSVEKIAGRRGLKIMNTSEKRGK